MKDEKCKKQLRTETDKVKSRVNDFMAVRQRLSDEIYALETWIRNALPVISRAFEIVIQENRLDEIAGCRGLLELCPVEMPAGWELPENPLRGWIRVEDRLPEWSERVLVFNPIKRLGITIAYLQQINKDGQAWNYMHGSGLRYGVTHWRPLPNTPAEVKGGEG